MWTPGFSCYYRESVRFDYMEDEDDYEILPLEICDYKRVVVLSLSQHIPKTTVESKRGRLRDFDVRNLQL